MTEIAFRPSPVAGHDAPTADPTVPFAPLVTEDGIGAAPAARAVPGRNRS